VRSSHIPSNRRLGRVRSTQTHIFLADCSNASIGVKIECIYKCAITKFPLFSTRKHGRPIWVLCILYTPDRRGKRGEPVNTRHLRGRTLGGHIIRTMALRWRSTGKKASRHAGGSTCRVVSSRRNIKETPADGHGAVIFLDTQKRFPGLRSTATEARKRWAQA